MQDILDCFIYDRTGFPHSTEPGYTSILRRLKLLDVPEDIVPVYGYHDMARGCFFILIEHPSFDLVDRHDMPPIVHSECKHFYVNSEGKECQTPSIEYRMGDGEVPIKFREFL